MAIGKNTKLNTKSKKGGKKKIIDPFARKDWFDVKAPKMFQIRQVGKTLGTRSAGTRDVKDTLRGRVFTASLGDLKPNGEDDAFRKFHLKCEDIQGKNVLTNFYGMELTRDKLCSLVRKWQSLIECHTDVKTADGYLLRVFVIGFTRKRQNQLRKTSYAQSAQARAIRKKMVEVVQRECTNVDLPQLVEKLIPEVIGKEIEKLCQGIYPLQNVFVRQVKTLRAPKLDVSRLLELHGGAAEVASFGQEVERVDEAKEAEIAAAAAAAADDA